MVELVQVQMFVNGRDALDCSKERFAAGKMRVKISKCIPARNDCWIVAFVKPIHHLGELISCQARIETKPNVVRRL